MLRNIGGGGACPQTPLENGALRPLNCNSRLLLFYHPPTSNFIENPDLLLHGRGAVPQVEKNTRIRIPQAKLDHFLSFLTSSNVVQDLPFEEKILVLSTKAEIKVPNVIRAIIPESIVKQYQSYCKETDFQPMSRSTLCRIMKVCSATVRKSLQGLDYVPADGVQAFDDLVEVVQKLGSDFGKGLSWANDKIDKLKNVKCYLKSDYKVTTIICALFESVNTIMRCGT